jgi:hypothetical protein
VAPDFTDFQFHNNGAAQEEYDAAKGAGAFAQLAIPSLADRTANFDAYLPVSANHPTASERFRHAAVAASPQFADLGLWNVYLNPDIPNPQTAKFNDVVEFYIRSSQLAHSGALRNAPLEFSGMSISKDDVNALVAFLVSLTEDYDDA